MSLHIIAYCIYLLLSVTFTVWVASTLHRNGRVFLYHIFRNDYALADSVNHLLVVGFYLVNLGLVSLGLRSNLPIATLQVLFEVLATKMGMVLLTLGLMHFCNMVVFAMIHAATSDRAKYLPGSADLNEVQDHQAVSFVERYSRAEQ